MPGCEYEWVGLPPWVLVQDNCTAPAACSPPTENGTYIGETRTVPCVVGP